MNVIVVGGGASGMMASIVAAKNGAHVTLLERNDRVGKKLLATGNGRCNYTNENMNLSFFHGDDKSFIKSTLESFNRDQTIDFFEDIGIAPAMEDGGKVYPNSFQASSMLDCLRYELDRLGVNIITNSFVGEIKKDKVGFIVILKTGERFNCDRVIISTGGMAMPVSGSDGNGYNLVKDFGHKVNKITPALVQLKLKWDKLKQVNGVKVVGRISLINKGKELKSDFGDLLFTDYGISGPPVLQISREAIRLLENGNSPYVRISIITQKSKEEVFTYILERFNKLSYKSIEDALIGFINKKMILPILKELDIHKDILAGSLEKRDINRLAELLTNWKFQVIGHKGWGQAQTTAGGILTKDINPLTLESKLVKGLYIIGETLDVDGDCGGYNLQWAWSTGYLAGYNSSID